MSSQAGKDAVLLRGARVVDPSQDLDAVVDLRLEGDRVAALGEGLEVDGAEVVDLQGKVVAPGFIDSAVSFGEPGFEPRETLASGLLAAAAGGFTSVLALPASEPPNDQRAITEMLIRSAERVGKARLYPIAALSKGLAGEELTEMGELAAAGAVAVGDGALSIANGNLLRKALLYARHFDLPVVHRACDALLADDGVMHEGEWSSRLGLPGSAALAEEAMVARDLLLAADTGGRYHLSPVTTAGSVEQIRVAKDKGLSVSCETTPHHLLLHHGAVYESGFSSATRVDPPLRSSADVDALLSGLADGTIDLIASDHRPYHADEKEDVQFSVAPGGIVGLETTVSLCLDRLVGRGLIGLSRLVELLSCAPARLFGLPGGSLAAGSPADITVLDLDLERTLDPRSFHSLGRCTPFAGWTLQGAAVATWVGGRRVYPS